jgi:hypothetical protein
MPSSKPKAQAESLVLLNDFSPGYVNDSYSTLPFLLRFTARSMGSHH